MAGLNNSLFYETFGNGISLCVSVYKVNIP